MNKVTLDHYLIRSEHSKKKKKGFYLPLTILSDLHTLFTDIYKGNYQVSQCPNFHKFYKCEVLRYLNYSQDCLKFKTFKKPMERTRFIFCIFNVLKTCKQIIPYNFYCDLG